MPPFSKQQMPKPLYPPVQTTERNRPAKSLEEFTNEIFGQLTQKSQPIPELVTEPVLEQKVAEPVSRANNKRAPMRTEVTEKQERPLVQKIKEQETNDPFYVVPTSKKQLMQAIIMSEVLGPPKAKQR